jgi:hypothetical protein
MQSIGYACEVSDTGADEQSNNEEDQNIMLVSVRTMSLRMCRTLAACARLLVRGVSITASRCVTLVLELILG